MGYHSYSSADGYYSNAMSHVNAMPQTESPQPASPRKDVNAMPQTESSQPASPRKHSKREQSLLSTSLTSEVSPITPQRTVNFIKKAQSENIDATNFGVRYIMEELVSSPYIMRVKKEGDKNACCFVGGKIITQSRLGKRIVRNGAGKIMLKIEFDGEQTEPLMKMYDYRTDREYTLQRKGDRPGFGKGQVEVIPNFGNLRIPIVSIHANMRRSHATMYDAINKECIGSISRTSCGVHKFVSGLDSYCVTIETGADFLLLIMLSIGFHELYVKGTE